MADDADHKILCLLKSGELIGTIWIDLCRPLRQMRESVTELGHGVFVIYVTWPGGSSWNRHQAPIN